MQSESVHFYSSKNVNFFRVCIVMFDLRVNGLNCIRSSTQYLGKAEKHEIYKELRSCLDIMEIVDEKPLEEVVGCGSTILTLLII